MKETSLITILSSEHGRLRREQRDIDKRSLQMALKHGTRSRCWGRRWKVEYDGIVFITDSTLRHEITAYPAPLASAEIDRDATHGHDKVKLVISRKPELCVSHTVLVVDNSASMQTHDINLHRDRQVAAYTVTALELVAEQLFNGTANNSDLVSLVEFSEKATVVFAREPVSWVLYNKLLERRDSRTFVSRESTKYRELHRCDSNYLPALDAARELLARDCHEGCALSLFFLSDGAPSDARNLGLTPVAAQRRMCERVTGMARRYDKQLNITMVGFGNEEQDFSTLQSMANAVHDAPGDASATFIYCSKMANAVGDAVTSLVTSLTATRTALMESSGAPGRRTRTKRNIASEEETQIFSDWKYYPIVDHFVYNPQAGCFGSFRGLPPGCLRESNLAEARRRQWQPPRLLAINTRHCGRGVERFAFRCHLADGRDSDSFTLGSMVAKETNEVERIEENVAFHESFSQGQNLAAHLADEFNLRLRSLPSYDMLTTPRISFLKCSVLLLEDFAWPHGRRGVLVEKKLDTERFEWKKWNNNAGAVDGKIAHTPIDVDHELAKLDGATTKLGGGLGAIAEGDSEDEESSESEDEASLGEKCQTHHSSTTSASDYLQAFTHFTYLFTNRKVMVCDLQGVYNTDMTPPTFELSDPAIHYASKRGREMVFGHTDKGKKGMQLFFNTHQCSEVCKIMKLSKRNKYWRKKWHRSAHQTEPQQVNCSVC